MSNFTDRVIYFIRFKIFSKFRNKCRILYYKLIGMRVATNISLASIKVTWPHQVQIGSKCTIEDDVYFKYDGIWKPGPSIILDQKIFIGRGVEFNIKGKIRIGSDSLIGSGSKFIDHDHGIAIGELMNKQQCPTEEIVIGSDVWIGSNVVILKGVTIGDGAIVAAGAVVSKNIASNEIWGGVPAKKLKDRN